MLETKPMFWDMGNHLRPFPEAPERPEGRVRPKLCRFVGKPRLLLIQQRNFWDFVGKLQEKV